MQAFEGHTDRLGRVAFHPFGKHAATASFDMTWRLWDVETGACLLEQEGHSRAVYTIAFQVWRLSEGWSIGGTVRPGSVRA